jgi:hypothetical protein
VTRRDAVLVIVGHTESIKRRLVCHPLRDELLTFTSALPADMVGVIASLGEATAVIDG